MGVVEPSGRCKVPLLSVSCSGVNDSPLSAGEDFGIVKEGSRSSLSFLTDVYALRCGSQVVGSSTWLLQDFPRRHTAYSLSWASLLLLDFQMSSTGVVQQKVHWKVLVLLIPGLAVFNMGFPTGFMGIEMNYVVICCKTRL